MLDLNTLTEDERFVALSPEDKSLALDGFFDGRPDLNQSDRFVAKEAIRISDERDGETDLRQGFKQRELDSLSSLREEMSSGVDAQTAANNHVARVSKINQGLQGELANQDKIDLLADGFLNDSPAEREASRNRGGFKDRTLGAIAQLTEEALDAVTDTDVEKSNEDVAAAQKAFIGRLLPAGIEDEKLAEFEKISPATSEQQIEARRLKIRGDFAQEEINRRLKDNLSEDPVFKNKQGEVVGDPIKLASFTDEEVGSQLDALEVSPRARSRFLGKLPQIRESALTELREAFRAESEDAGIINDILRSEVGDVDELDQEGLRKVLKAREGDSELAKAIDSGLFKAGNSLRSTLTGAASLVLDENLGQEIGKLNAETQAKFAKLDEASGIDGGTALGSDVIAQAPELAASFLGAGALAKLSKFTKAGKATTAAKVGSGLGAGASGGLKTYDQALGAGFSKEESLVLGVKSALITGGVTLAGSGSGTEQLITKLATNEGRDAIKKGVAGFLGTVSGGLKGAGKEGIEEATDQLLQAVTVQAEMNPDQSIDSIIDDAFKAFELGALLGGVGGAAAPLVGGSPEGDPEASETAPVQPVVEPEAAPSGVSPFSPAPEEVATEPESVEDSPTEGGVGPVDSGAEQSVGEGYPPASPKQITGEETIQEQKMFVAQKEVSKEAQEVIAALPEQQQAEVVDAVLDYDESQEQEVLQALNQGVALPMRNIDTNPKVESLNSNEGLNTSNIEVHDSIKPPKGVTRIAPAPLAGGTKPVTDILFDASRSLDVDLKYRGVDGRAAGTYYPGSSSTRVKFAGDLDVSAHEIAHALDDKLGLVDRWASERGTARFDSELEKFWPFGSVTKTGPRSSQSYKRAEGVAEWIRAWLVNPERAVKDAPDFANFFTNTVPEGTRGDLRAFGDDIRKFAGAPASQKVIANVQRKTPRWTDRFGKKRATGIESSLTDQFMEKMFDKNIFFKKAINEVKERTGKNPLPEADPMTLLSLRNGAVGQMELIFNKGMFNSKRESVLGGGFDWLVEPFNSENMQSFEKDMNDSIALMISERTLEKAGQLSRETNVSGIGAGVVKDTQVANEVIAEMQQDPDRYQQLKEAGNRYRQWADANLQYLVDKGRMTPEEAVEIRSNNQHYVSFERLLEVAPGQELEGQSFGISGQAGSVSETIKKLKGSSAQIQDPYASLLLSSNRIMNEADRNEVVASFVDMVDSTRSLLDPDNIRTADIATKSNKDDKNVIPVFRGGKKEYWQFSPDLFRTLKGLNDIAQLPGALTFLPRLLRWGVTNAPAFAVRNYQRDIQQRLLITRSGVKQGIRETFRKTSDMDRESLQKYGGDQFGHRMTSHTDFMKAQKAEILSLTEAGGNIFASSTSIFKSYGKMLDSAEKAGRYAEYRSAFKQAKDEGLDDYNANLRAAYEARGLMDFAVAGTWGNKINQLVPFFNAAMQGLSINASRFKDNPQELALRWVLQSAIPSTIPLAMAIMNGDEEEYRELPDRQRDFFYNFKITPDSWLRIPKNFESGVLGSGVERAIDTALGAEKSVDGYFRSLALATIPVDEQALLGPFQGLAQAFLNRDLFRDKSIVPFEENKRLELRDSSSASRLGQGMQKLVEGIGLGDSTMGKKFGDARVVDFLIKSHVGIIGDTVLRMSNMGRENARGIGLRDIGLFTGSPAYASKSVQDVYDKALSLGISSRASVLKPMREIQDKYYQAKTGEEKDSSAVEWREVARETFEELKKMEVEILKKAGVEPK